MIATSHKGLLGQYLFPEHQADIVTMEGAVEVALNRRCQYRYHFNRKYIKFKRSSKKTLLWIAAVLVTNQISDPEIAAMADKSSRIKLCYGLKIVAI